MKVWELICALEKCESGADVLLEHNRDSVRVNVEFTAFEEGKFVITGDGKYRVRPLWVEETIPNSVPATRLPRRKRG